MRTITAICAFLILLFAFSGVSYSPDEAQENTEVVQGIDSVDGDFVNLDVQTFDTPHLKEKIPISVDNKDKYTKEDNKSNYKIWLSATLSGRVGYYYLC